MEGCLDLYCCMLALSALYLARTCFCVLLYSYQCSAKTSVPIWYLMSNVGDYQGKHNIKKETPLKKYLQNIALTRGIQRF